MTKTTQNQENQNDEGILEIQKDRNGRLLKVGKNGKRENLNPFISKELIQKFRLKNGNFLNVKVTNQKKFKHKKVIFVEKVDGMSITERQKAIPFPKLTTITPNEKLEIETTDNKMTNRMVDLFCPIGKGQRGLIVAPPKTGKTTLLKDIANGILENQPECHVMVLLVDERPEEVTDFKRSVDAEIFASSNDEGLEEHIRISELAIERSKCLVESGKDVVLLIDSLTRLSRAYNSSSKESGKTMTGGLDVRALEKPRKLFSSARKTEESGSLTILASALIETGSKMDDLIFQEFKGTGNMEMVLDKKISEMRIFPAININASGTRKEELLIPEKFLGKIHLFRRALAPLKTCDAAQTALSRMSLTGNNKAFLSLFSLKA